ncbi:hypothetical protein LEP1GSC039_1244 [Leptospira santarosai str. 2000027870]|nr:hypothetical protein LEP1GSC039_1244 [Leptospira santarosai str. 2000027870]
MGVPTNYVSLRSFCGLYHLLNLRGSPTVSSFEVLLESVSIKKAGLEPPLESICDKIVRKRWLV